MPWVKCTPRRGRSHRSGRFRIHRLITLPIRIIARIVILLPLDVRRQRHPAKPGKQWLGCFRAVHFDLELTAADRPDHFHRNGWFIRKVHWPQRAGISKQRAPTPR